MITKTENIKIDDVFIVKSGPFFSKIGNKLAKVEYLCKDRNYLVAYLYWDYQCTIHANLNTSFNPYPVEIKFEDLDLDFNYKLRK